MITLTVDMARSLTHEQTTNKVDDTESDNKPKPDSGTVQCCSQAALVLSGCLNAVRNLLSASLDEAGGNLPLVATCLHERANCKQ